MAIDIGNTRVKIGWFPDLLDSQDAGLPIISRVWALPHGTSDPLADVRAFANGMGDFDCLISSVNPPASHIILAELARFYAGDVRVIDSPLNLPIVNLTIPPEKTGLDRLLKGVAANVLRQPQQAAIVVDSGTAATVDLITAAGEFAGGAILPGLSLSARALHTQTAQLPLIIAEAFAQDEPHPVGRNTLEALHSGLYWGHIGAIRELVQRLRSVSGDAEPALLVTGGAGGVVARGLGSENCYRPYLTLQGIAVAARAWPHRPAV